MNPPRRIKPVDLGDDPDGDNTLPEQQDLPGPAGARITSASDSSDAVIPTAGADEHSYPLEMAGTAVGRAGEPETSVPAAEAEAAAGTETSWEPYDQTLAAAVRERDRALDKATSRLASVTAGGYLEYDRSVSIALAAFESAWHNAKMLRPAVPR